MAKQRAYLTVLIITVASLFFARTSQAVAGGSISFNGTNQYVTVPGSTDWAVGTGDFTVEWFQYQTSFSSNWPRIFTVGAYPTTSIGVSIEGGTFYAWLAGSPVLSASTGTISDRWVHFAVSRSAGTLKIFKNGVQLASASNNSNVTNSSQPLYIGSEATTGTYFGGLITNFHFVKGTGLYTSAFTPSGPVSAVANTKLLLNAVNESGLITDSGPIGRTVSLVNSPTFNWGTPFPWTGSASATSSPATQPPTTTTTTLAPTTTTTLAPTTTTLAPTTTTTTLAPTTTTTVATPTTTNNSSVSITQTTAARPVQNSVVVAVATATTTTPPTTTTSTTTTSSTTTTVPSPVSPRVRNIANSDVVAATAAPAVIPSKAELFSASATPPSFFSFALDTPENFRVSSTRVAGTANALQPGSKVRIVMYSDPVVLGEAIVDQQGSVTFDFPLPANAPPGEHTITVEGQTSTQETITALTTFTISETGRVEGIVPATEIVGDDIESLNLEGARAIGVPVYDTTRNVAQTAAIATTTVLVTTLVGATAASMNMSMGASGSTPASSEMSGRTRNLARREDDDGSSPASDTSSGTGPDPDSQGNFASVEVNLLTSAAIERVGFGDKRQTWWSTGFSVVNAFVHTLSRFASSRSVFLTRIAQDGHWVRSAFGSIDGLVWLLGIVMGVVAAVNTNSHAALPVAGIALTILALSMIDAMASFFAWIAFTVMCAIAGNVSTLYELRTIMGLGLVWIALPSIASAIRPFVRQFEVGLAYKYERLADYVVMSLFASYAASSAYSALNGLSGLQLVSPDFANQVRIAMIFACIGRLLAEDAVMWLYPQRSSAIAITVDNEPGTYTRLATIAFTGVLYLVGAGPFFGLGWRTWLIILLMMLVPTIKLFSDSLPNIAFAHKWFPRGILRSVMMVFVSAWFAQQIFTWAGEAHHAQTMAVFLMLPGIAIGFVDCIAREGGEWSSNLLTKVSGAALWLFLAAVLTGNVAV